MSLPFLLFLLVPCHALTSNTSVEELATTFQLMHFNWEEVKTPCTIGIWLLVAALAKIFFNNLKPLTSVLPDSSLLIAVGLILGCIIRQTGSTINFSMDYHVFFLYLLPPIIFDAGYFMPNRALFENIGSVLLFSVVGTLWNTFAIGASLLLLQEYNVFSMTFSTFEIFVFSALISAVDPVAVIAVFEEIHVNEFLFVNVFGEALFNDGVTVVLYQMFKSFAAVGSENLGVVEYTLSGFSFFVVALGGMLVGIIFAFLTALATKYTYPTEVRILAPVFVFVLPYMAYLVAEMVSLSPIIAIATCGMIMKQYVKGNITLAAASSVKYFIKMMGQSMETVIFMFLGLSTISSEHYWDLWFVLATIGFCLLWRTVGVIIQCAILNLFRHKKFSKVDQFILSYGGLRGAIAFGLAVSIPVSIAARPMFITTTICVIYFTVFLQGITIRPLVKFLDVELEEIREPTMTESVYGKYLMYMMSGLEVIAGLRGQYTLRDRFERFNGKFLRPVLMRHETKCDFDASTIVRAYNKITLDDAMKLSQNQTSFSTPRERAGSSTSRVVKFKEPETSQNISRDEMYAMFNEMLDKKLKDMRLVKELDDGVDIQDDYMKQMEAENVEDVPHGSRERSRSRERKRSLRKKSANLVRPVSFAV